MNPMLFDQQHPPQDVSGSCWCGLGWGGRVGQGVLSTVHDCFFWGGGRAEPLMKNPMLFDVQHQSQNVSLCGACYGLPVVRVFLSQRRNGCLWDAFGMPLGCTSQWVPLGCTTSQDVHECFTLPAERSISCSSCMFYHAVFAASLMCTVCL